MNKKIVITLFILFLTSSSFANQKLEGYKTSYMSGDYNQTYKLCLEAIKENYSNDEAHYYLALYYLSKGSLNDAKVEFKNVIQLAPGTKLASYSAVVIQNIFDEQNKDFSSDSLEIATVDSSKKSSRTSRQKSTRAVRKLNKKPTKVDLGDGENYFFNAVNNDGKIVRWDANSPINIYIPDNDQGYSDVIKQAFSAWNSAYSGFKFEYVKNPQAANMVISFKDAFHQMTDKYDKAGEAKPIITKGLLKKVDINLKTTNDDGKPLHSALVYNTVMHEIGHALGIWGHSDNNEDIMFPVSMAVTRRFMLSQRDKNTIMALYKNEADITNKKRSLGKNTVLSNDKSLKESSKAAKIEEARKYVAMMPDDPNNWIKLGYTYETYGEPQKALENYAQALKRDPNNLNALKNTAAVYFNMKKYPNAINVYKRIIQLEPDSLNFYHDIALSYINLDRDDDAQYWLDMAVKQDPNAAKDKKIKGLIDYLDKKKKTK